MPRAAFRQNLSLPGLLATARKDFKSVTDEKPRSSIPLAHHLMSGLAMFGMKYPSLLQFDKDIYGRFPIIKAFHRFLATVCHPSHKERLVIHKSTACEPLADIANQAVGPVGNEPLLVWSFGFTPPSQLANSRPVEEI